MLAPNIPSDTSIIILRKSLDSVELPILHNNSSYIEPAAELVTIVPL